MDSGGTADPNRTMAGPKQAASRPPSVTNALQTIAIDDPRCGACHQSCTPESAVSTGTHLVPMRYTDAVPTSQKDRSLVGRHPEVQTRLARGSVVSDSQRARLLEAMAQVVSSEGYAATTVSDVVRSAGVSRSTFYELFESKEQCFVEAYRHGIDVLFEEIRSASRSVGDADWEGQLRASNKAFLATLQGEPRFARTYLIEIHTAGAAALQARSETLLRFADGFSHLYKRMRPDQSAPPYEAFVVLAAGFDQAVAERVRSGKADSLVELEPVFTYCAMAILAGPVPASQKTTDRDSN